MYVPEGSDLSFWAVGQDYYDWAEVYSVYIGESGVPAEMELLAGDLVTTDEYQNIILDLSAWEGKTVHIAFRHYNVTDQYKLNIDDVDIGISAAREPHVFGEEKADTAAQVLKNWELIKMSEKDGNKMVLSGVPRSLPSLIKAERVQEKAANVGFD